MSRFIAEHWDHPGHYAVDCAACQAESLINGNHGVVREHIRANQNPAVFTLEVLIELIGDDHEHASSHIIDLIRLLDR
jgi:hypothetical protein